MALKVFVTDGDQRPALAITRALGRRGLSVLVGADQPVSLASTSKYCHRHVTYPSPGISRTAFDEFLVDFVEREQVDILVPVTDVTMHAVCRSQERLKRHCAMAVPPLEAFEFVTNKWSLLQAAAHCGIPIPRTHIIAGIAGLKTHIDSIEYPAVVKPSRSRIQTGHGWLAASVHYAHCERDLWRLFRETPYLASYPSLIQRRIVGPGIGVFVLCDRGRQIACFAHRRLREKPPAGGISVLCESIAIDPDLRRHADRLLGPRGWHGVAMLEFKQDVRSGTSFLMEVNGRELALGRRPEAPQSYEVGAKNRWLLGDLDHLLLRLLKKESDLHLPESAPSKIRTIVDFMRIGAPNVRCEVERLSDPRPFLHELRQSLGDMARAALRRGQAAITANRARCRRPGDDESHRGLIQARARVRDARRRIACGLERGRMAHIRRHPAALKTLLRSAKNILILCHGNIIRSPFAARLLEQIVSGRAPVSIRSAGVQATAGTRADRSAIAAASRLGVDLQDHVAAPLTPELVAGADVILVMDVFQVVAMRARFPEAGTRTFLLASLCPGARLEIRDPFGGDASRFHECYGDISRAVRAIVDVIAEHRSFTRAMQGAPVAM